MLSQPCKMPEGLQQRKSQWWKAKYPLVLYYTFVSGTGPDWHWGAILLQPTCKPTVPAVRRCLTRSKEFGEASVHRQQRPSDTGYSGHNPNHPLLSKSSLKGLLGTKGKRKQFFRAWECADFKIYTDIFRARNKGYVLQRETENILVLVVLNYTSNLIYCKALNFKHLNGDKLNIVFLNVGKEVDMKEREKRVKLVIKRDCFNLLSPGKLELIPEKRTYR